MKPYESELDCIILGAYIKFRARESKMKPGNYGVYGLAASSMRWRAVSDCEPDRAGAEELAELLNEDYGRKSDV